ncbi:MAG: hypothetical protein HY280_00380 [Nitrospinae bacterium]|nr:hypothetical protein [Nitrospinota bacterium]
MTGQGGKVIIAGGRVYDPSSNVNGEVRDVEIVGGEIFNPATGKPIPHEGALDASGCVVMAGAIDVHSHPIGVSRLARFSGFEELAGYADLGETVRKYLSMGCTYFVEAGLSPNEVESAQDECEKQNIACSILPLGEVVGVDRPAKFVCEKGVEEFFKQPDDGVAHHVHLPHLAKGDSLNYLEQFLKRLAGRRCHLSHISYYAFEKGNVAGAKAAEMISEYPNVTVDCGPIVFGPALTFTADEGLSERVMLAGGGGIFGDDKSVFSASPYLFQKSNILNAEFWINGMEFLLSSKNLSAVSLSIDYPSGGDILGIPFIIACLMDSGLRGKFLETLSASSPALKNSGREFSLYEIAIVTRHAPSLVIGRNGGGAVIYEEDRDFEKMFAQARHVITGGGKWKLTESR